MLLITFKAINGAQLVYSLAGDVRAIHLPRLEQIVARSLSQGMTVCFDMTAVLTLDAGALRFFSEGSGRVAVIKGAPTELERLRGPQETAD